MDDAVTWRIARPFASASTLRPRSNCAIIPLLDFLIPKTDVENSEQTENQMLHKIDDSNNSTLTPGQQERYRKLHGDPNKSRWTVLQKREFRTLNALVQKEQDMYRQALHEFLLQHVDRFMAGFPASHFATWHSSFAQTYVDSWKAKGMPLLFGKVRQIISLSQYDATRWIPNERFESKVIEKDCKSQVIDEPPINLPTMQPPRAPNFLRDDESVIQLAKASAANIILSVDILEHVLMLDSWKCVLWNHVDGIRILELPFPQPVLPRHCLEQGIEWSLRREDDGLKTLMTVKSSVKPQKVLIRGRCVSPRVHIEYFPERGVEELSSHDKAAWILDSIMEPGASTVLVRVNATDWTIQSKETVGIAHALASGNDVIQPWNRLLSFLRGLDSAPTDGDYLMVCRDQSVSLHKANDKIAEIDLAIDLESADVVKTGTASLLSCICKWKWDNKDRLEDTFPTVKTA